MDMCRTMCLGPELRADPGDQYLARFGLVRDPRDLVRHDLRLQYLLGSQCDLVVSLRGGCDERGGDDRHVLHLVLHLYLPAG